jgi:hypothetical protein
MARCHAVWVSVVIGAHLAGAQPAGDSGGSSGSGSGSAEPTFEPEHITTTKPAQPAPPPAPAEPITVDAIVISSTNRVDLNFFFDLSYVHASSPPSEEGEVHVQNNKGFFIGPIVLQATAHLAQGLTGRTEIALSYQDFSTVVDVERADIEYKTDHFSIRGGRNHTEYGYWNNAFHHGRWLQLTINRPHVLRFEDEGGMLQIHQVGLTMAYGPKRGESGFEAVLGIGNGHSEVIENIQTEGDNNYLKSALVRLGAVGIGHPALRFGVNAGIDRIKAEGMDIRPLLPGIGMWEYVFAGYIALRSEGLQIFSETYHVIHTAVGGIATWRVTDGFFLLGYRFGSLIPYAQVEVRRGDGAIDPYWNPQGAGVPGSDMLNPPGFPEATPPRDFTEGIAGLHYDLNSWSALKLEVVYGRFDPRTENDYRVELNWSFGR